MLKKERPTIEFEWDLNKAKTNLQKHRVAFGEAATIFSDRLSITIYDPDHSDQEDPYITTLISGAGRF